RPTPRYPRGTRPCASRLSVTRVTVDNGIANTETRDSAGVATPISLPDAPTTAPPAPAGCKERSSLTTWSNRPPRQVCDGPERLLITPNAATELSFVRPTANTMLPGLVAGWSSRGATGIPN